MNPAFDNSLSDLWFQLIFAAPFFAVAFFLLTQRSFREYLLFCFICVAGLYGYWLLTFDPPLFWDPIRIRWAYLDNLLDAIYPVLIYGIGAFVATRLIKIWVARVALMTALAFGVAYSFPVADWVTTCHLAQECREVVVDTPNIPLERDTASRAPQLGR